MRDACYATLADTDRQLAHRRAAAWLESKGEGAAVVLASHWERAGDVPRAVASYLRAMEQSLRGNDLESVIALAERAERCGAEGELLGKIRLLESDAFTWMGAAEQALNAATQAVELLPRESVSWHGAMAAAVEAAMVLGRPEAADPLVRELARVSVTATTGAEQDRAAALARASFALVLLGRAKEASELLVAADRIAERGGVDDPMTLAHLSLARAGKAIAERKLETAAHFYTAAGEAIRAQRGATARERGARQRRSHVHRNGRVRARPGRTRACNAPRRRRGRGLHADAGSAQSRYRAVAAGQLGASRARAARSQRRTHAPGRSPAGRLGGVHAGRAAA